MLSMPFDGHMVPVLFGFGAHAHQFGCRGFNAIAKVERDYCPCEIRARYVGMVATVIHRCDGEAPLIVRPSPSHSLHK
jgi:hypothetical protein